MELKTITRKLLLLLIFTSFVNYSFALNPFKKKFLDDPSGGIVIIDDDLLVDTQNANNVVANTKIYDVNMNLVHTFTWCQSQTCQYNISQLTSGIYTIKVTTASGYYFTLTQFIQ